MSDKSKAQLLAENEKLTRESLARGAAIVNLQLQLKDAQRDLGLARAYINRYRRQRENAKIRAEAATRELRERKLVDVELRSELRLLRRQLARK